MTEIQKLYCSYSGFHDVLNTKPQNTKNTEKENTYSEFEDILNAEIQKLKDTDEYCVYSDFDLEKHKQTFINYLEVIMFPDGHIEYAVPSHQEKLINIAMKKFNTDRKGIEEMCEEPRWFEFQEWLCEITECISIWGKPTSHIIGTPNTAQKNMLDILIQNNLL